MISDLKDNSVSFKIPEAGALHGNRVVTRIRFCEGVITLGLLSQKFVN
ncbi:MAG: hypothetical protein QOJ99_4241 [Bryobacterales bacterium]|nr:hypothetical protein [Bryobacterales bacterium]